MKENNSLKVMNVMQTDITQLSWPFQLG